MTRVGAVLLLGLAMTAAPAPGVAQESALEDVVVERHQDTTLIRLRTSGAPRHQAEWLDRPPRIIIDLAETRYAWKLARLAGPADPIKEIRGTQLRAGVARVVIELTRKVDYRIDPDADGVRVAFAPTGPGAAPATAATPPPAVRRPEAVAAPPRAPRPVAPRLHGVVHGNRGWVAYIEDPDSRRVGPYRVGDALGGAVVEQIEADTVTLSGPAGPLVLQLGERRPARSR